MQGLEGSIPVQAEATEMVLVILTNTPSSSNNSQTTIQGSIRIDAFTSMSIYTSAQISKYLEHIGFRHPDNVYQLAADNPLQLLTQLQLLHMARVPFESLSLHYSQSRLLSLDLEDLFDKIVNKGCGGYCMEVNAFFATVLRSLGFKLISVGGRVARPDGTYKGWYVCTFKDAEEC
jgi:Arylamine N-acetyltransferase